MSTAGARQVELLVGSVSSDQALRFPPAFVEPGAPSPAPEPRPLQESLGASARSDADVVSFSEIDRLLEHAVRTGRTPGAVVIVGRQTGVLFRRAYGSRALIPQREATTPDTIFDLASLTKPLVVGTLVQWLIERGLLRLEDRVADFLPEFGARAKGDVSVEQVLLHTAGLPSTNSLREYREGPERARALALGGGLVGLPGRQFMYSDVGYIALGAMIEQITGESLDRTAERVLWAPLGMHETRFCPSRCLDARIAPTELARARQSSPLRGEVHDPRAYALGGVAGNAGLFSTADDLARFARMLLGGGELDGTRVLSRASVDELTRPRQVPHAQRALGWDIASELSTSRGHELSARAYGHGGYTGTSLWIDPALDLFVLFLSNRNHPYGRGKVIDVEGKVADAAVRALRAAGSGLQASGFELQVEP